MVVVDICYSDLFSSLFPNPTSGLSEVSLAANEEDRSAIQRPRQLLATGGSLSCHHLKEPSVACGKHG